MQSAEIKLNTKRHRMISPRSVLLRMKSIVRRVLNVRMKTVARKVARVLGLLSLGLLYNEILVYYLVLMSCRSPPPLPPTAPASSVMVLADTHLLGSRLGHWADKLRREWQMYRAFQTAQTLFSPRHVFFLGLYLCVCSPNIDMSISR